LFSISRVRYLIADKNNRLPWDRSTDSTLGTVARAMKSAYRDTVEEPLPEQLVAILRQLEEQEKVRRRVNHNSHADAMR
jgi:hypothetical protein